MVGWLVLLLGSILTGQTQPTSAPTSSVSPTTGEDRPVAIVAIEGEINDYTHRMLINRVAQAKLAGAKVIILRMDTPGGSVGSTMKMTRFIQMENPDIEFIAYVRTMAYSAGTWISVSCNEVVMQEGAMIGDCAPIIVSETGGLQALPDAERAKVESPIVAAFEECARRTGASALLYRAFVQYKVVIHAIVDPKTGQRDFVNEDDYAKRLEAGWQPIEGVSNPLDDASTLLTMSATTAKKIGFSKGTYADVSDFIRDRGMRLVGTFETSGGEYLVEFLNSAWLRGILGIVFGLSCYVAFQTPGHGAPEFVALVTALVLFGVPLVAGYASWFEILLVLLGLILISLEIFVIPGFGVPGIVGIVLVLLGLILTFAPAEPPEWHGVMPSLQGTYDSLKQGLMIVLAGTVATIILGWLIARHLPSIPIMNRMVLKTTVGSTPELGADAGKEMFEKAWPHVGAKGTALTDLRPGGMGQFFDQIINDHRTIDVISDYGFMKAGDEIRVKRRDGMTVVVEKA